MTIEVTVQDVRDGFSTSVSDAGIQRQIDMVINSIGACLESNYDNSKSEQIVINIVQHNLTLQSGGVDANKKAASGAQIQKQVAEGQDIRSTPYGQLVYQLDSAGCYELLYGTTFLFMATDSDAELN